ncbi:MAG TPA: IclR family transcriptional regulator [Gaiellaceae bacterium]|nr:IclR family transcriptional regulator [Gaiellaceae bacterium]
MSTQTAVEAAGVKSARRALEILEHLTRGPIGFSRLADELGYPRSSLHGLLATLTEMGWVELDPRTRTYSLGIRAWEAGRAYLGARDLVARALPFMERVRDRLDETVQLAVLDGRDVVYVARVDGSQRLVTSYSVGGRVGAHASAGGKALLALLPAAELERRFAEVALERYTPATIRTRKQLEAALAEARERGYGVDEQEYTLGVRCLAVPVLDHEATAVAAMSVSVPIVRFDEKQQARALAALRENARLLSQALGHSAA